MASLRQPVFFSLSICEITWSKVGYCHSVCIQEVCYDYAPDGQCLLICLYRLTTSFLAIMTNLIRHMDLAKLQASTKNAPAGGNAPALKSLDQGAATSIFAAFDPSLNGVSQVISLCRCIYVLHLAGYLPIFSAESSIYLEDCHNGIAEAYASDPDLAVKLWKLSESIVGQSFSLKVESDA